MAKFIDDLVSYLKEVLWEGLQKVFTCFDILGIVIFFRPQLAERLTRNEWAATGIGASIFVLSFLVANFILYRKLKGQLDEFEDTRAKIYLKNTKDFCYAAPIRLRPYFPHEGKRFRGETTDLLLRNGLPIGLIIGAELKVANHSNECGCFDWEITKVDMPEFFNLVEIGEKSFQWGIQRGPGGLPLVEVTAHSRSLAICELPLQITIEDPRSFAKRLSSLGSYCIVIEYSTIRIDDSKSKPPRSLKLEGDFQEFRDQICKDWKNSKLDELAQLAECE